LESDAFDQLLNYSGCYDAHDAAALDDLSGIDPGGLDSSAIDELFVFSDEDVSPAFQGCSGSSLQSLTPSDISLSTFSPNSPSSSSTTGCDRMTGSHALKVIAYKCPHAKCGEGLYSKNSYRKHCANKHPAKRLICKEPDCGKSFLDGRSLQRHLTEAHSHGERAYTCHCSASQPRSRWYRFKKHINFCRAERTTSSKYTCYCGQDFHEIARLEAHQAASHTGKRGRPPKFKKIPGETQGEISRKEGL